MSVQAPTPRKLAIVCNAITANATAPLPSLFTERPVLISPAAEPHDDAVVMRQIVGMLRHTVFF